MNEVVLDASVIVKWFRSRSEPHVRQARLLREKFEAGELAVVVPSLLFLEVLNIAGRRWKLARQPLTEFAGDLGALGFEIREPDLRDVAEWTARGLTAYDASYVALAAADDVPLITDDAALIECAPKAVRALSSFTFEDHLHPL
jgi:predicted nucleic acid-binding protein